MIDDIIRYYNSNFQIIGFEVRNEYFEEELDYES